MIELDGILSQEDYLMIDSIWKSSASIPEFIIKGDVEEIINRPLSYNIIIVPFYLHEPYYVNIKLPKYTGSISNRTWELFNSIKPLNHVHLKCKRFNNYLMKNESYIELIDIESIESKSKFPYQYCNNCNMIHMLSSSNEMYQCCASPNLTIIHSIDELLK